MPTPADQHLQQRLDAISQALGMLVRENRELRHRVEALEQSAAQSNGTAAAPLAEPGTAPNVPPSLSAPDAPEPPPLPSTPPPTVDQPISPEPDTAPLPPFITAAPPGPAAREEALETRVGLWWVNRIAVVTLILGAAFLFKYGIDRGWLGPGTRCVLGVVSAAVALAAGERMWRRQQRVFAQGLTGLGLALLYLTFWAAAQLYHLIPTALAFVLMCGVTVGAAFLALRYAAQAVAALGLIGGYLTPLVLSSGEDRPWFLFSYLLMLNAGGLVVSRIGRWRPLVPLAVTATMLYYLAWLGTTDLTGSPYKTVATVFAFAFYAEFSLARMAPWLLVQLVMPVAIAVVWGESRGMLAWELLFAAAGLALARWRDWAIAPSWTLAAYAAAYGLAEIMVNRPPGVLRDFLLLSLAFLMFFSWTPWRALVDKLDLRASDVVLMSGAAIGYFAACYDLLDPVQPEPRGMLAAAIGGLYLLLSRELGERRESDFALGIAFVLFTLAIPIQFAGFRITMAWALEGAALSWIASRSNGRLLLSVAWIVLGLALLRLLMFDSWMYLSLPAFSRTYTALLNSRFLTFATVAGSLWCAVVFLLRSEQLPASGRRRFAAAAYSAGHAVLLLGLALEINGWVNRNVAPADQDSVATVSLSILFTVYAVVLILAGLRTRQAIHRILGLGLIAIVVAKLYLVDVWVLGRLFRITAFLALGALMLAVSYTYSRFRELLERLWRSDRQDGAAGTAAALDETPPGAGPA